MNKLSNSSGKGLKIFRSSKSAISIEAVVELALFALMIAVVFYLVFPVVKEVLVGESEKGTCEWSLVMHSIAKVGDWSLIPAECRAHRIEIDMNFLDSYKSEAKKRIKQYNANKEKYVEILPFFNNPDDEKQIRTWALNRIIAVEMKDCWEKVMKGKLPLFDAWWKFFSWDVYGKDIVKKPTNREEAFSVWNQLLIKSTGLPGTVKLYGPPTNCIICSRIKFSDDVKNYFAHRYIPSLNVWLKHNYPATGGKSYYNHIVEGQSQLRNPFIPRYASYNVDTPLSVTYEKIYTLRSWQDSGIIKRAWQGTLGQVYAVVNKEHLYELNYVKLVPYTQDDLVDPIKGEGCTFILD